MDFSPGRGSEQQGVRPGLVVQNDKGNANSPTTIIVAMTTQARRPYPFQVAVTAAESGLDGDGLVLCEQVVTIDQSRLREKIGELTPDKMQEVDKALRRSLQM